MKVILMQDVAKLGRSHTVVEVPNGYGLNQLIPKGLALPATPNNLKKLSADQQKEEADSAVVNQKFFAGLEKLGDERISVSAEANEQGHLFAALSAFNIQEALQAKGIEFSDGQIHIKSPIKELGEHEVFLMNGTDEAVLPILVEAK